MRLVKKGTPKVAKDEMDRSLNDLNRLYDKHQLSGADRDVIWEAHATLCSRELHTRSGEFYEAAKHVIDD